MPELDPSEEQLGEALRERRPKPPRAFTADLRERLRELEARARRPPHLWRLVGAYVGSGVLLLVLAALGAAGGGPFG